MVQLRRGVLYFPTKFNTVVDLVHSVPIYNLLSYSPELFFSHSTNHGTFIALNSCINQSIPWQMWCTGQQWKNHAVLTALVSNGVKYYSFICGNKMPTRCNRGFYCRSYCLLNMFQATLCPSSGAQEYYTVVAACGISCCGFQVAGLVWSWWLCVRFAGCSILQTGHITLSSTPDQQLENHSTKYHRQPPLCNTLELLMMGIVVPETCWASNKICNKNLCCI